MERVKSSRANTRTNSPRVKIAGKTPLERDRGVAALLAAQDYGHDNGDSLEVGRTRAASLACWLRENQHRIGFEDKLAVALQEMQRAPGSARWGFIEHIAHLVALGSQHVDVAADLAQRNAHDPLPGIHWNLQGGASTRGTAPGAATS